jgi:hypothetical protein
LFLYVPFNDGFSTNFVWPGSDGESFTDMTLT